MHPAVYTALTEARETELRTARRHHTPSRPHRRPRRLAAVAALASIVVAGAIVVSDSSASVPVGPGTATNTYARLGSAPIAQPGQFGWQARCPATKIAAR
jgi:hypothetical protein